MNTKPPWSFSQNRTLTRAKYLSYFPPLSSKYVDDDRSIPEIGGSDGSEISILTSYLEKLKRKTLGNN